MQTKPAKPKDNNWFTPAKYIEAARVVMNGIDLDPASCELANRTVKATRYYTEEQNGLMQDWHCKSLWLNPPYCLANRGHDGLFKSTIENFSDKLIAEYAEGNVEQAIMLVPARVDSQWFQHLWEYPLCFPDHPIKFNGIKNNPKNSLKHMWGAVFVYLGPHEQKFIDTFSQFGRIAKAVDEHPATPITLDLWQSVGQE